MKAIDGLLNIAARQGATELRLASDRPPRLFRRGEEMKLTMPPTSAEQLRTILGDFCPPESAGERMGATKFVYRSADAGEFDVTVNRQPSGNGPELDVRFSRRAAPAPPGAAPAPESAPAVGAPPALSPSIHALIERAAAAGASDLHLTEGRRPVLRVDGELRVLANAEPPDVGALLVDSVQRERVSAGGAVDLGIDVAGVGRLRVNVFASADGLSAAIRILKRDAPRLSELHLLEVVQSLIRLPHGLVIVCGPTGSGKSTTLAALAQEAMRSRAQVLITLEDPIEYRIHPGAEGGLVRQREIGRHASDFATGLRDALREDPDVLLIGEMRDAESISLALTAAETGHLVLTSLHSRTSSSAVERIVDIYPPERQRQIRVQLADALRAVVAQRLVPRADSSGRVVAAEFLRVNSGVANLIREGKTPQILSAMQSGGDDGMVLLERNLADLVRAQTITLAAARAVGDAKALDEYLAARR